MLVGSVARPTTPGFQPTPARINRSSVSGRCCRTLARSNFEPCRGVGRGLREQCVEVEVRLERAGTKRRNEGLSSGRARLCRWFDVMFHLKPPAAKTSRL